MPPDNTLFFQLQIATEIRVFWWAEIPVWGLPARVGPPCLRIWELLIFRRFLLFSKILAKILTGFYYSQKKFACGGLLLLYFSQKGKFGLSDGRFFSKISVFALKYPKKIFACGGLADPGFYYSQKNFACGGLLLFFFFENLNFFLALIIFLKSWQNFLWLLLFYF